MSNRIIFNEYRQNAKRRGISFDLSFNEFRFIASMHCQYCGSRELVSRSMGVDRVNNQEGYSLLNCVPCCSICNRAKKDLPNWIFERWIRSLAIHYRARFISGNDSV